MWPGSLKFTGFSSVYSVDTDVYVATAVFANTVKTRLENLDTINAQLTDRKVAKATKFSDDAGVSQKPKVMTKVEAQASSASSVLASMWLTTLTVLSVAISFF